MVTLQCSVIKIRHNIRRIKPYKYDPNVEDINPEYICDNVKYDHPIYTLVLY